MLLRVFSTVRRDECCDCGICLDMQDSESCSPFSLPFPGSGFSRFQCKFCGLRCHHRNQLEEHITAVHIQLRQFACPLCHKRFSYKKNLIRHAKMCHFWICLYGVESSISGNWLLFRIYPSLHLNIYLADNRICARWIDYFNYNFILLNNNNLIVFCFAKKNSLLLIHFYRMIS